MNTVYFDESGYTGGDLINQDQKVFVLSSLWLTDEEARALKDHFFSRVNAPELKFSASKRKPKHLDAAIDFFT